MRSVIDQEDSHAIVSERCSEHRILGADGPHPFDTIKARMGATHFLMKWLPKRRRRDGVARPRLQSHACDEHDWHAEPDLGERHLRPNIADIALRPARMAFSSRPRVFPRF